MMVKVVHLKKSEEQEDDEPELTPDEQEAQLLLGAMLRIRLGIKDGPDRGGKSSPVDRVKYSDEQDRDENGRWTDGSGSSDTGSSAESGASTGGSEKPAGTSSDSRVEMPPETFPNPSAMTGFDREHWTSMPIMEARDEWNKLSNSEKDKLAGPERTIEARIDILTSGKEGWKNSGDTHRDITDRVTQFRGDRLTNEASKLVEGFAMNAHDTFIEAGAKPEAARELAMKVTDYLVAQDFEAAGRTLGDHGIHHLSENVRISGELLKVTGQDTPEARAAMYLAGAFHDAGYLTPPSRAFLDDGHPRWGAQNFEKNIAPLVKDALGEKMVGQLSEIIGQHDTIEIDWAGAPLKSAFATADNISLFHYEKMPALLRYVPDNTKVLVALGEKNIDAKQATALMLGNIDKTNLPDALKSQLRSAAHEVSPVLPKYTLGMVGVKLQSVKWEKDHPSITLRRYAANEAIGKVLDVGQRQFSKLAETYGQDAKEFAKSGHMLLTQKGKTVLEFNVVNKKAWEGLLTDLYLGRLT